MGIINNLSGVTVNGVPAVEYIAKTQTKRVRNKTFTNGISRDLNLPEPEPDFTQWVIIKGVKYLRVAKEPIAHSGQSLLGALQYDQDTDKIKCHICGEWYLAYGGHRANRKDHPEASQYKKKHGLKSTTRLVGLQYLAKMRLVQKKTPRNPIGHLKPWIGMGNSLKVSAPRNTPTIEQLNSTDDCPEQIPVRIKALAVKLGRTPTKAELIAAKISLNAIRFIFGSVGKCMKIIGLTPNEGGGQSLSDDELISSLVSFRKVYDRWPKSSDIVKSGLTPSYQTYRISFGGLPQAIAKAESRLHAE